MFASIAQVVLICSLILGLALGADRLFQRIGVPAPLVFLIAGVGLGSVWSASRAVVTPEWLTVVGTIALIVILLQGGLDCGLAALRQQLAPVLALGVVGTAITFGLVALAAHTLLGLGWTPSLIIGAILAPTDPAAVFSVLGGLRARGGRIVRLLEGEAGLNDPVAIALLIALVDGAKSGGISSVSILTDMAVEGAVGAVAGLLVGAVIARVLGPSWPVVHMAPALAVLAAGFAAFGLATLAHGSGFLAVYICGLLIADDRELPERTEVMAFSTELASLAEVAMFVLLGIALTSVDLSSVIVDGLILTVILVILVRPVVCYLLLRPFGRSREEISFSALAGLKGAVPILLAAIPVMEGIDEAERIFATVGLVVMASLAVQGMVLARTAPRLLSAE